MVNRSSTILAWHENKHQQARLSTIFDVTDENKSVLNAFDVTDENKSVLNAHELMNIYM